jgi:hypothetical protein
MGSIFAYHRILLFEGIYSQIKRIYPNFGRDLIQAIDRFGYSLDELYLIDQSSNRRIKFFRYHRIMLGDAVTKRENNIPRLTSYLQFKNQYKNKEDDRMKQSLSFARLFVENLPESQELAKIRSNLSKIKRMLETKIKL